MNDLEAIKAEALAKAHFGPNVEICEAVIEAALDRATDRVLRRTRYFSDSNRANSRMYFAAYALLRDEVLGWGESKAMERYEDDCRKLEQVREAEGLSRG